MVSVCYWLGFEPDGEKQIDKFGPMGRVDDRMTTFRNFWLNLILADIVL